MAEQREITAEIRKYKKLLSHEKQKYIEDVELLDPVTVYDAQFSTDLPEATKEHAQRMYSYSFGRMRKKDVVKPTET